MDGQTADSLVAYIDDVAIYDMDESGTTIADICPNCEVAPAVPTDSSIYRVNINSLVPEPDGFNTYIPYYRGDTCYKNLPDIFGQCNGIDLYLFRGGYSRQFIN